MTARTQTGAGLIRHELETFPQRPARYVLRKTFSYGRLGLESPGLALENNFIAARFFSKNREFTGFVR
jgi:hypothetical protein